MKSEAAWLSRVDAQRVEPAEAKARLDERDAWFLADDRSLTGKLLGDPLPHQRADKGLTAGPRGCLAGLRLAVTVATASRSLRARLATAAENYI